MINMVISHEKRFVFLGIPRTANRAMHYALLRLPGAFRAGYLHEMGVPPECHEYFTFCCVRNPYQRFLSYYRWRRQKHPWGGDAIGMSFEQYISAMEKGQLGPSTIRGHTENLRLDKVIRFEELPDSLLELNLFKGVDDFRLVKHGQKLSRHWKQFYDPQTADRVYQLCQSDFEEFDYDRNSWAIDAESTDV